MSDYNNFSIEKLNELAYQNDPEAQRALIMKAIARTSEVTNAECEYWLGKLEENENNLCKGVGHFLHGHYLFKKDFAKAVTEFGQASSLNYYPAVVTYIYYALYRYYENLYVKKPGDDEIYRRICEHFNYSTDFEARRHCADNFLKDVLQDAVRVAESDGSDEKNPAYIGRYDNEHRYLYTFLGCYYYNSQILLSDGHLDEAHTAYDKEYVKIVENDVLKAEKCLLKAISYGGAYEACSLLGSIYTKIYDLEVKYIENEAARSFSDYKKNGFEYFVKALDGSPERILVASAYARVIKSFLDGEYSNDNIVEIIRKYFQREDYFEFSSFYNGALKSSTFYFELSYEDLISLKSKVSKDIGDLIDAYIHRSKVWVCWNCGAENRLKAAECEKCNSRLSGRFDPLKSTKKEGSSSTSNEGNVEVKKSGGCYVATCVYGSYDCPEVWVLRRYRDLYMKKTVFGRWFINTYYKYSPQIVEKYGKHEWFHNCIRPILNKIVNHLSSLGLENTPYDD